MFYCDDCDLLTPAISVFRGVHPSISVHTSSDINDLLAKVNAHKPDLILVYLHDPDKDYISVVKTIRKNAEASTIPVVIYKQLPDEQELKSVFQTIASVESQN